jgi:hypothetical protein
MTNLIDKPSYGADSEGCWFDGARGIYIGDCVIREALLNGWECDTDLAKCDVGGTWTDHEHYHELTDEAEEFMQQFAAEGFYFGYHEHSGDWGLWACSEEEERNWTAPLRHDYADTD